MVNHQNRVHFHMLSMNGRCLINYCPDDTTGYLYITPECVTSPLVGMIKSDGNPCWMTSDNTLMAEIFQTTFSKIYFWTKCMNFPQDFTEVCPLVWNSQYSNSGSDNGLAPTRRQATIWTNDDKFTETYMCPSASMQRPTKGKCFKM